MTPQKPCTTTLCLSQSNTSKIADSSVEWFDPNGEPRVFSRWKKLLIRLSFLGRGCAIVAGAYVAAPFVQRTLAERRVRLESEAIEHNSENALPQTLVVEASNSDPQ